MFQHVNTISRWLVTIIVVLLAIGVILMIAVNIKGSKPQNILLGPYQNETIRPEDAEQLSRQALTQAKINAGDFTINCQPNGDPFWVESGRLYTLWFPTDVGKYGSISYGVYLKIQDGHVVAQVNPSK